MIDPGVPCEPAFSIEEYRGRVVRAQALMAERGLDAMLVRNRADVCYLTGLESCYMVAYHAAIVPAAGEPTLVASDFEMLNARLGSWCQERVTFVVGADPIEATCCALRERGLGRGRLGVETGVLTAAQYDSVQEQLPDVRLVESGDLVARLKVIKSPAEAAYLREAGRLTTQGMVAALAAVAEGKTDNDVAAAASEAILRGGSEFPCIEPIVTAGRRSGVPHSTFHRHRLRPSDAVLIEIGACVCRYSAPLMRTAALAPVPPAVRRAANACRDALNVVIEQLRPGAVACEVAAKARAAWSPLCEELIWHGIYAYSVGIGFPPDWNDAPVCVTASSDVVLQAGMCFHVTTSLRQAGEFGTALSETVLLTENGNEVLTGTERELWVVG
jgi:Xaa-Pro dipeptidase